MNEENSFICVASWEERFRRGFDQFVGSHKLSKVWMYFFKEYETWTQENREWVKSRCEDLGIQCIERPLAFESPRNNWLNLKLDSDSWGGGDQRVTVDISTMPREIIWYVFWLLERADKKVNFCYARPEEYSQEWLSKDPQRPRLVYKMSGISKLGFRTALVILAGYDIQRTAKLIRFFEPEICLIGLQASNRLESNRDRMGAQARQFQQSEGIRHFAVDAYSSDFGRASIQAQVLPFLSSHNVIMTSLGPKLSAVALYQIYRSFEDVGLAYAPAKEFNKDYSKGMREVFQNSL